ALIAAGMSAAEAYESAQSHAITRWLGRDSEDIVPTMGRLPISEDGWLLACSDGLWNYAPTAAEIGTQVHAAAASRPGDPEAMGLALVEWATGAGGHDNITVALARFGPMPPPKSAPGENGATESTEESQDG